jgi:hypothetical protein
MPAAMLLVVAGEAEQVSKNFGRQPSRWTEPKGTAEYSNAWVEKGEAPVWGSEFTSKAATLQGGDPAEPAATLNVKL